MLTIEELIAVISLFASVWDMASGAKVVIKHRNSHSGLEN